MEPDVGVAASELDTYLFVILGIIILAGGLGGLVNYFLAQSDRKARRKGADTALDANEYLTWWQSMIIGVASALLVPLFLSLISSTLLAEAKNDVVKGFVFAGFCLAAGIASRPSSGASRTGWCARPRPWQKKPAPGASRRRSRRRKPSRPHSRLPPGWTRSAGRLRAT